VRVLIVVQRYGEHVLGGAEACARGFAVALTGRGHTVTVMTSCAASNLDWANVHEPGVSIVDGVTVHRLPVAGPMDAVVAFALETVLTENPDAAPIVHLGWARAEGPWLPDQDRWLSANAGAFDVASFFTYRYATTTLGLPVAASLVPTVMHPMAHDEATLRFRICRAALERAGGVAYLTDEEHQLVDTVIRPASPAAVVGTGIDLSPADGGALFRGQPGVGDEPYLLYAGRLDPGKGVQELAVAFAAYKASRPGPLRLLLAGETGEVRGFADVVIAGWLAPPVLRSAMAGAVAVVAPSALESFSLIVAEAWAQSRPVVVNGASPVLTGQVQRSQGGLTYLNQDQFDDDIDLLLDPEAAAWLGANGRRYVEATCAWPVVLDRYEAFLAAVMARWRATDA